MLTAVIIIVVVIFIIRFHYSPIAIAARRVKKINQRMIVRETMIDPLLKNHSLKEFYDSFYIPLLNKELGQPAEYREMIAHHILNFISQNLKYARMFQAAVKDDDVCELIRKERESVLNTLHYIAYVAILTVAQKNILADFKYLDLNAIAVLKSVIETAFPTIDD